jgi:hypothetical protein
MAFAQNFKGRTIRYLRGGGGLGKYQKKIRAQKKFRKKISCTTNLLKKKIEQELGVIFKIVLQLFENSKMVLYDNRKKIYVSSFYVRGHKKSKLFQVHNRKRR